MAYPRIHNSGLSPQEIAAASASFEDICRMLQLSPREDSLRDLVADAVIDCVKRGVVDPHEILPCVEHALTHGS
jgi:hypothetical protein